MTRWTPILLTAALAAWAPGCKKKGEPDHVEVGLAGPVKVTLLAPGSAPRRALRYRFARGVTQGLRLEVTAGLTGGDGARGEAPAVRWPTYRLAVRVHPARVGAGGALALRWRVGRVTLQDRGTVAPEHVPGFRKALGRAGGLRGRVTLSARGIPSGVAVRLPLTLPGQVKKALRNGVRQLVMPVTPLPVEPVGKGARWAVELPLRLSGMSLTQRVEVELVALTAAGGQVRWTITQPTPTRAGASAGGGTLPALTTRGSGAETLTLGGFAPRWRRRVYESHRARAGVGGDRLELVLSHLCDVVLKPE